MYMCVINTVLNLIAGVLCNKFRDHTAKKLKGGDLTDEQCYQVIVRELDDIKTKLDALSRKDLLSSLSFLEEGFGFLSLSQTETTDDDDDEAAINQAREEPKMMVAGCSSFSQAISRINISSKERFTSAKISFEKSNTAATNAFNNEALSTEERILATKLRATSRILISIEDPDAVVVVCKGYLKQLHCIRAVKEIFSTQLYGGIKSILNKTRRLEHAISVTMINYAVFDFAKKFTKISVHDLYNWPKIELSKRTYNPMFAEGEILTKVEESGVPSLNQFTLTTEKELFSGMDSPQTNSKGEIIAKVCGDRYNVFKFTAGECQLFTTFWSENVEVGFKIHSLAIDGEDNAYIVTSSKQTDCLFSALLECLCFGRTREVYHFKLFVFDAKGDMKHRSLLKFLEGSKDTCTMAVTKNKIVIHKNKEDHLHVCNSSGELKYSFPMGNKSSKVFLSISDKNEIIAAIRWGNVVYIYTEKGKLRKRFKVPDDHSVYGVTFNHVTKEIIVLTRHSNWYLSRCSRTGKLQRTSQLRIPSEWEEQPDIKITYHRPLMSDCNLAITGHPSGPVAIIHREHVLYIQ